MARTPLFHRAHYNVIAAQIRELYSELLGPTADDIGEGLLALAGRATLEQVALRLAKRFAKDNPEFDPHVFLGACSPDKEVYPLGELWEDNV